MTTDVGSGHLPTYAQALRAGKACERGRSLTVIVLGRTQDVMRRLSALVPYTVAAGVGAAAVTSAILFTNPILGGDDVWLRAIADGSYTGEPSERLIFMNAVLGWVLRGAYNALPDVAWYALLLYGLIGLSIAVVAWLILPRSVAVRIAVLIVGLYLVARPLAILSWTETGLLVVGAGVLLATCGPPTRMAAIVAGLLVGLGYMLRMESIGLVLAAAPLLWVARHRWRHLIAVALVGAAIIGPAQLFDRQHYTSDTKWAEWSRFEKIRRDLHGTPRLGVDPQMRGALATVGWSQNDLRVFKAWHYLDEDVFSTESLATLLNARRFVTSQSSVGVAESARQHALEVARRHAVASAIVAMALGLVGARRWWVAIGSATWLLALFTVMEVTYRSRARLEAVIVAAVAVGLVLLLAERRGRRVRLFAILPVLGMLALTVPDLYELSAATANARAARAREMKTLERFDPDATYVQIASSLKLRGVSPFDGGKPPVDLVMVGWTVRTPHFSDHLGQAGLDDLYLDPLRRPDVYLVGVNDDVASIVEFMREHYDVDPAVERVERLTGPVKVWQLTEGTPSSS